MKTTFIFHGVGGNPKENWFPWLKEQLENLDQQVIAPQFPTPEGQTLDNWLKTFKQYEDYINEDTILVGHSLGVPFALNLIERHEVKAAFFVAGFCRKPGNEFDSGMVTFLERDFDWNKIKQNCKKFYVFHSDNDPYVKLKTGKELAEKLDTEIILIPGAGHFNKSSGYIKFDLLLSKIKQII